MYEQYNLLYTYETIISDHLVYNIHDMNINTVGLFCVAMNNLSKVKFMTNACLKMHNLYQYNHLA